MIYGETKGNYDLEAEFNGTLMPFEEPVKSIFRTAEPFRVWGTDALHMSIEQDDYAYVGQSYHVRVGLKNVSSETVYNMNLSLNEGEGYTLAADQQQSISVAKLTPGETLWLDCKLLPERTGQLDLSKFLVMGSAQDGSSIPTTITPKPAPLYVYCTYEDAVKRYDGSYHFYVRTLVENLKNYDAINVTAQISAEPSSGVTLSGGNMYKVDKIKAGWNWYIYWGVDIAPEVNLDITKVKVVVKADNEGEIGIEESLASVKEKAVSADPVPGKDIPLVRFVPESPEINKELDIHVVFEGIQSMDVTITDPEGNDQHLDLVLATESYYSYRYTPGKAGNYTITAVTNGDPTKKATKFFNIQGMGNAGGNTNHIIVNYQVNDTETTSYEITANNITNIDGKPLVDIRYIAKALGGSTTWSSLREDNRISAILALDFKSSDKQIILNTNTHKATVGSMGSSSVQDLPNLTFEAFTGEQINLTNQYIRADILEIARILGFGDNISETRLPNGSIQYTVDATTIPRDMTGWNSFSSFTVSILPVVGDVKDVQEAVTGVDLITGVALTPGEQVITVVCVFYR